MKTKQIFILIVILLTALILATWSCEIFQHKATLSLSLTDAPAVDVDEVWIDFGQVQVSMSSADNPDEADWVVINSDGGRFNLLTLANGEIQDLGVGELEPGQYNQIRIYVDSAEVVVDGTTYEATVNSDTIKLVKAFTLEAGITTELIADFNAAHSVKLTGSNNYRITPVVKLTQVNTTGKVIGTVASPKDVLVTASAYAEYDASDVDQVPDAGTVCDENGDFLLGYIEAGTYDIVIEAEGYQAAVYEDQVITAGGTISLSESGDITLQASTN